MPLRNDGWAYARPSSEPSPDDLHDISLNDETLDSHSSLPPGSRPECLRSLLHELDFVALIALAAATPVFLQRSIVVVTSSIAESLRMPPAELAWSTASSGLTTGAFLLPFGHIADTCGLLPRKTLLLISLTAFSLLAAGTSFSQSGVVLDVVSGLTGVACAANIPIALGILSLVYSENSRRRNLVFSSFFMGTPAATIIGGLGSGGLSLKLNWRAPFVALGGFFTIITILVWAFVPNVPEPKDSQQKSQLRIQKDGSTPQLIILGTPKRMTTFLQFDWAGLALLLIGVLLFTVSLTIGPEGPEPWKTPTVILLLTLGLLFLGCFILWQNVAKRPMIPPSIWNSWSITLVVVCTLGASMAFYSQLFWVSMFMQQVENLNSFEVAVRLLPQALVGIFLSPLVGLFMHAVPGTGLLVSATFALVLSNVFLIFLRHDSHYMLWIFPSLMLSTVGMDWVMNVGSLHILSSIPPEHHSIGASLLQTTSRLGVPLGLAITTSIWSSYDGKADWSQPELAYTHTFIATTSFSCLSLLLAPFIRIGKQGSVKPKPDAEVKVDTRTQPRPFLLNASVIPHTDGEKSYFKDIDHRPSKRWSTVSSVVPSFTGRRSTRAPSISSQSSMGMDTSRSESISKTTIRRGRYSSEKLVWIVCEECGTSKRQRESSSQSVMGDPTRYFNDVLHNIDPGTATRDCVHSLPHQQPHHQTHHPSLQQSHHLPHHKIHHQPHYKPHYQANRPTPPNPGSPIRHNAAQRPYPGRRRLPLVNRQIMTHQMLTQGFQP